MSIAYCAISFAGVLWPRHITLEIVMKSKGLDRAQALLDAERRKRVRMIMARVAKGEAIADVARELGISRQRVSQIVQQERKRGKA